MRMQQKGFTLVELMFTIVLIGMVTFAMTWAMQGALQSWAMSKDQLALQKVLSETMDRIMNGTFRTYGLKDSLEILQAETFSVTFVPPWMDDTHQATTGESVYTMNRRAKPGSAVPVGQIQVTEDDEWRLIPVQRVELEGDKETRVSLGIVAPESSLLRFVYHPDAKSHADVKQRVFVENGQVFEEQGELTENISANPFGVLIDQFEFYYFTHANQRIDEDDAGTAAKLLTITGMEVVMEARLGNQKQTLVNFVAFRNSPMKTGYLTLHEDMEIPIPDSRKIHTLELTNFSGVRNGSVLNLKVESRSGGSDWVLHLEFEKFSSLPAKIKMMKIEYPAGNPVFTDFPRTDITAGVDLLSIGGSNGIYDYDEDPEVQDVVLLEGETKMTITEMTVEGAGLFVRP